ncbi:hypothetical protein [Heyndrickxia coagulans]|uniref:MFS transporter, putative metabolite:H+ symporter n=1 Tax=Heyndrickxia coagulans DSM 1 = ATCC 7050 TaxID=1121088 RepID=A0A8B4BUQ0_HEYCO|nr:hypothetical protein [Heyndrickxia coagulans]AJH79347.1 putative membrane protein [Heyndrickxia coagulans DSM 1 = ATCC 7050]MED4494425.1 hypothetical protein [Heyndrickxia coagulans]UYM81456.1 hypothetical protein OF848_14125 [Heyndrickxia coagulans]SHF40285.1 MFS transporter, putative metabolite:H+ symporter [Heyndrickxia coagulans DSM 1 = ATCC 7050]
MAVTIGAQLDQLAVGKYHKRATIIIGVGLFFEFFEVFLASVLGSVLSEEFHVKSSMLSLLLGSSFLGAFAKMLYPLKQ